MPIIFAQRTAGHEALAARQDLRYRGSMAMSAEVKVHGESSGITGGRAAL